MRYTTGTKRDGTRFCIIDDWRDNAQGHIVLPFDWRVYTLFFTEAVAKEHLSEFDEAFKSGILCQV